MARSSTSFPKGQSGNAKGRPRKLPEVRELLEEHGAAEAVASLRRCLKDRKASRHDKNQASKTLLEWAMPRPQPTISNAELEKLELICAALLHGEPGEDEVLDGDGETGGIVIGPQPGRVHERADLDGG